MNTTADAAGQLSPAWPEQRIECWAEFQEAIDGLAGTCVFRGQSSRVWPLASSFKRLVPRIDSSLALDWERATILKFRSEAHSFLPPTVMPPDFFKLKALDTYLEWLMIMQHYGAPTRLLDWSQSPYVGSYFAVNDDREEDAALWYFASAPVESAICIRYGRDPGTYLDYADFSADEICCLPEEPIQVYVAMKKMRTVREVAQQGVFTFTNQPQADQQDAIAIACQGHTFGRIVIPHRLKTEFCNRLAQMNVTAAALFPGVEGVCASIRDLLRRAVTSLPTS